jgi:hypothetical protein
MKERQGLIDLSQIKPGLASKFWNWELGTIAMILKIFLQKIFQEIGVFVKKYCYFS